VDAELAIAMLS